MDKSDYIRLRNRYRPSVIRTVFILESPPASGKYFYNPEGSVSEQLFSAMMGLLGLNPKTKREGLDYFCNAGYFLVDATYKPVNELKGNTRDATVLANYEYLVEDLRDLGESDSIDIILVKANICRLLGPRLRAAGFNVVNNGVIIPFPGSGQQGNFRRKMAEVFELNSGSE